MGVEVGYGIHEGWWFDTGKKDDILFVNSVILDERIKPDIRGEIIDSKNQWARRYMMRGRELLKVLLEAHV
jgi:dTDP-glucose pyrophosphorylase